HKTSGRHEGGVPRERGEPIIQGEVYYLFLCAGGEDRVLYDEKGLGRSLEGDKEGDPTVLRERERIRKEGGFNAAHQGAGGRVHGKHVRLWWPQRDASELTESKCAISLHADSAARAPPAA